MPKTTRTPTMTEKQLQGAVQNLARLLGWKTFHAWISVRSAPGFPDLVCVRGERLLFAELKTARGVVSAAQQEWLDALRGVPGVEVHLWYPAHWHDETIERVLR